MAAAGVHTTKGLYFTFTLLGLVCLASSVKPDDELEKLKLEMKQVQQKQQDCMKVDYESVDTYLELFDDIPQAAKMLQKSKDFMKNFEWIIEELDTEKGDEIKRNLTKLAEFLHQA
ncbi:uncharacterized protein LOC127379198 isoform X4 [Scomber scombrus]|uniref:Uncharacterized protein LOC127379198 isoform X4 n=1 Tax=Scomber scombrus TaxID=13677 RepID=A0AAV1P878_SCOSC